MADVNIRVLLADDQALVRDALAALIESEADIDVIATVASGAHAVDTAAQEQPDVCLMDVQMPGMDGIEATARLRQAAPRTRVLIVTTFARPGYVRDALDAGASGFIGKDAPAADLIDAIRQVHRGGRVVDPSLATQSLVTGANPLTDRERDVLRAAADGRDVRAIAAAVFLAPGTVRNHLSSAIGKTAATNRAQAVRIAEDNGWI